LVWFKFVICILIIFLAGRRVAKYGDIIANRTGLGQLWMGLVVIALVTSLPELFTGISAVTIVDAPDLTIGDLIGANTFNLLNLALLDIAYRNGSILAASSPTHRLMGWFSLLLVLVVAVSIFVSTQFHPMAIGWIGWYTPVILILYCISMRQIFRFERQHPSTQETGVHQGEEPISLREAASLYSRNRGTPGRRTIKKNLSPFWYLRSLYHWCWNLAGSHRE